MYCISTPCNCKTLLGVIITGGEDAKGIPMKTVELYWSDYGAIIQCFLPDMSSARSEHTINNMEGGEVSIANTKLVCGGHGGNRTCERYRPGQGGRWDKLDYMLREGAASLEINIKPAGPAVMIKSYRKNNDLQAKHFWDIISTF